MSYFYKIRKIGTNEYYAGNGFDWCDVKYGYIWYDGVSLENASKTLKKLRDSYECELVKFKFEEIL